MGEDYKWFNVDYYNNEKKFKIDMKEVTHDEFDKFLENKRYIRDQGIFIHSEDYIDFETRKKIAYYEWSSYGAKEIFKIQDKI